MAKHAHAVVWIDHHEARIIYFNAEDSDETVLHPDNPPKRLHTKSGTRKGVNAPEDQDFYHEVAEALGGVAAFLITGPASAKTELVKHFHRRAPQLIEHLRGVETLDKITTACFWPRRGAISKPTTG